MVSEHEISAFILLSPLTRFFNINCEFYILQFSQKIPLQIVDMVLNTLLIRDQRLAKDFKNTKSLENKK